MMMMMMMMMIYVSYNINVVSLTGTSQRGWAGWSVCKAALDTVAMSVCLSVCASVCYNAQLLYEGCSEIFHEVIISKR